MTTRKQTDGRGVGALARRTLWRAGRRVYHYARGEQSSGDMNRNGEAYVQTCVLAALELDVPMQVFDIGGNAAEWTLLLLEQAAPGRRAPTRLRVDAFEPVPSTATTFAANLARAQDNELVRLHRVGLSDQPGQARIAIASPTGGRNSLHGVAGRSPTNEWVEIELTTFDRFCQEQEIDHVHLAKCDTEGHDTVVMRGARDMLCSGRVDVFQFEYNHQWVMSRTFLKDVFDFVDGLPYHVARVDPKCLTVFDGWHPELERFFQANYALVHERALGWFDVHHAQFDHSNTFG